ncbi:hypothetical protein [uncultured Shewanella sp.]|uniref:hypothetical protein n=1 Tax=uncultured Shewanella sp. TaxID=173975 RepID=UPI00261C67EB|nr:hypothetical protein [uncultured Shewanella sp.]
MITKSKVAFSDADQACLIEGHGEYVFATPRNKVELNKLIDKRNENSSIESIWINYHKKYGHWKADIGEADDELKTFCQQSPDAKICSVMDESLKLIDGSLLN